LLAGSLYRVSATDPARFVVVPALLVAVAALAQAVPIARARSGSIRRPRYG